MIIAHRTAPGAYTALTAGAPVFRQVLTSVAILDSTIADPALVETARDVAIWDATLVDGRIVRTERTVEAFDRRPRDGRVVAIERPVPATDVITHPFAAIVAMDAAELDALDLLRVVETEVPAGKISVGWTIEDIGGVPTQVHALEDAPPVVVAPISYRQLVLQLLAAGKVDETEALAAAASRAMPAVIAAAVGTLPAAAQISARITWATMTEADRASPLVDLIAAANAMKPAEVDDFFRAAALL